MRSGLRGMSTLATPITKKKIPLPPPSPEKGDYVPVCMAVGMIGLSVSLGLYTAMHQLAHSPNVFVKKVRREKLPEVLEPEHVVEDAEKFLKKSLFRKIGHIEEPHKKDYAIGDPSRVEILGHTPPRVETLKSVGLDPAAQ
ncbi:hypothetical protein UlMin_027904 [Ulmus minor]